MRVHQRWDPNRLFVCFVVLISVALVGFVLYRVLRMEHTNPAFWEGDRLSAANREILYKVAVTPAAESDADTQEDILSALRAQRALLQERLGELTRWDTHAQERFRRWFGDTDESSRQRVQTVLTLMLALSERMTLENFLVASLPKRFALVARTDTTMHKITVLDRFFTAPLVGFDSKAGVMVHEMSHFVDIGGTWDQTYGQKDCQRLLEEDPQAALFNGDNYEYYVEDAS